MYIKLRTAGEILAEHIRQIETDSPGAAIIIVGDFNECRLNRVLPNYHQYVNCPTRKNKTLDFCFSNISDAYYARSLSGLGKSDHCMLHMVPSYRQKLKRVKPTKASVLQWTPDSIDRLRACLDCTNWDELFEGDCNSSTEVITDYISFCIDLCIPVKTVKRYPNNKPWFTSSLKHIIQLKQEAFRNGDEQRKKEVQKLLKKEIRKKKYEYKSRIENYFHTNNTHDTWRGVQTITGYKTAINKLRVSKERDFADELNEFYARFDKDDNEQKLTDELICLDDQNTDSNAKIVISLEEVYRQFRNVKVRKAPGPDNITGKLLKECCTQLAPIFTKLFQMSLDSHTVPRYWKTSCIIPVPKVSRPEKHNDYRPVALTSIPMKCLERIILKYLVSQTLPYQDPLQFAYRQHRSTEDAVLCLLHTLTQHLDTANASVRILFVDFSSAFNTISPNLLIRKLENMSVNRQLIRWVADFLIRRPQFVKVNSMRSHVRITNTGSPQGSVISPSLFTIFTSDCTPIHAESNDKLYKFADDKALAGLITADQDTVYKQEVDRLVTWCDSNNLFLNVKKTKELIIDFRKNKVNPPLLKIKGEEVERVNSYKYLGILLTNTLSWDDHINMLNRKCQQRMYFLRKLHRFDVSANILYMFYRSMVESIICYCISCWGGSITCHNQNQINRVIKAAKNILGVPLPSFDDLYMKSVKNKSKTILSDKTHPLNSNFIKMRSGTRYHTIRCRTNRCRNTFVPSAVRILNQSSTR